MRLLPMVLLAVVAGVALVYAPLITTGTAPSFARQFAAPAMGDNTTAFSAMFANDTAKLEGEDRIASFESNVLNIQPSSTYGVLLGPSIAVVLGLLAAIVSYVIIRRALSGFKMTT